MKFTNLSADTAISRQRSCATSLTSLSFAESCQQGGPAEGSN
jgi:hypothetical protein